MLLLVQAMPWAPPAWCADPPADAAQAIVSLSSGRAGKPRKHDISGQALFWLKQEHSKGSSSSWQAAVLRNREGGFFIMDFCSVGGAFMNGKVLEPNRPYKWQAGVVVVLGRPPHHDSVSLELVGRPQGLKRSLPEAPQPDTKRRRELGDAAVRPPPPASAAPASASSSAPTAAVKKCDKCDKCDGPHPTDRCPHFKQAREEHKDAWANYGKTAPSSMGKSGGRLIVRQARHVPQPGDGSCLFHSLCFGLNGGRSQGQFRAGALRKELANFIQRNPQLEISGDTIEEWVRWDARTSVSNYARRMASGGWGGGLEMAACSILKKVNVHVYERRRAGAYERISCFDSPCSTKKTIHVLYQGGVHYDALAL